MRWKWTILMVVIAVVLAVTWAIPYVLPNQDLGLNELNQLAGVASLAVAIAALLIGMWALRDRSGIPNDPPNTGTTNTIHGNVSGQVFQADHIKLGTGKTEYYGDHIDFSGGTFHGKVVGKEEHHRHGHQNGSEGA